LFLCSFFFSSAPRHEDVLGEWRYSTTHSLTTALDGYEWSASRPGCFTHRERVSSSPQHPERLWGPIQWVPGTLSLGVKRPEPEADHLFPFSAEIKNVWKYTSTLPYVFMTWYLLKNTGKFKFIFHFKISGWTNQSNYAAYHLGRCLTYAAGIEWKMETGNLMYTNLQIRQCIFQLVRYFTNCLQSSLTCDDKQILDPSLCHIRLYTIYRRGTNSIYKVNRALLLYMSRQLYLQECKNCTSYLSN